MAHRPGTERLDGRHHSAGVDTIRREEADRRRAIAGMELAEIKAETARGHVVPRSNVESDVASFCAELYTGFGSASNRIASRATWVTSATQIEGLCHAELNGTLTSAIAALAKKWFPAA